ncbi:MAG: transcriptional [Erysipelotrichaceae bacterium]|nr:MAG: transcriptional [Erysipelotrichaceae bacterium]
MEVSASMFYLLLVLTEPIHGYQIMKRVEEVSAGSVKMGAGTCYGLIARCQKEHLIKLSKDDGKKKTYLITELGQQLLDNEIASMKKQIDHAENYWGNKHD